MTRDVGVLVACLLATARAQVCPSTGFSASFDADGTTGLAAVTHTQIYSGQTARASDLIVWAGSSEQSQLPIGIHKYVDYDAASTLGTACYATITVADKDAPRLRCPSQQVVQVQTPSGGTGIPITDHGEALFTFNKPQASRALEHAPAAPEPRGTARLTEPPSSRARRRSTTTSRWLLAPRWSASSPTAPRGSAAKFTNSPARR